MVILSPGIYTVLIRDRAITSIASSFSMANAGAAICMPMQISPSAKCCTEKASSISVVVTSSMEKACTLAIGSSGALGKVIAGKPRPLGNCSNKNLEKCSCKVFGIAPTCNMSLAGVVCKAVHAASTALYSIVFLSGLNNNCGIMLAIELGSLPALSSST